MTLQELIKEHYEGIEIPVYPEDYEFISEMSLLLSSAAETVNISKSKLFGILSYISMLESKGGK